jgi:uncharacterized protein YuzE
MKMEYDRQADAIYIHFTDDVYSYGDDLDNERRIDYNKDDIPIGVELLCVSAGVNISGLPSQNELAKLLTSEYIMAYSTTEEISNNNSVVFSLWAQYQSELIESPEDARPAIPLDIQDPDHPDLQVSVVGEGVAA